MSTPGNREVAHRVFAAEFDDADLEYSESDEERAPNYVVTPGGARINRLYFVGVLTETESVSEDVLRARVVDPTGAFVVYAGQYQPDELAFLESVDPPAFVAVTGKARTFQPDDSDRTFTSVRPETITEVTAEDRDRWAVTAAEHTLDRVGVVADALGRSERGDDLRAALVDGGVPHELADGVTLAVDHYGTNEPYLDALRTLAVDVASVVAGEREEVRGLDRAPDDPATERVDTAALQADAPEVLTASGATADVADATSDAETASESGTVTHGADAGGSADADADADVDATPTAEATTDDAAETGEAEPEPADEDDELGDFEGGSIGTETVVESDDAGADATADPDEATANTDEMYEFDEEERQEIEAEYGTEFSTGTEVESPDGEAAEGGAAAASAEASATDADAATEPDPEPTADDAADEPAADEAAATDDEPADDAAAESDDGDEDEDAEDAEAAADAPLDEVLLDAMGALDDGDGADRAELIETVVDQTGADAGAVEDAIQDALMGGQCYEPGDDKLKPI